MIIDNLKLFQSDLKNIVLLQPMQVINRNLDGYSMYVLRSNVMYAVLTDPENLSIQYYDSPNDNLKMSITLSKENNAVHIANIVNGVVSTDYIKDVYLLTTESSFFQQSTLHDVPYDVETYVVLVGLLKSVLSFFENFIDTDSWIS